MLVRITPAMQDYLAEAISDSARSSNSKGGDTVYVKIRDAINAAERPGKTVTIVATAADVRELVSRANHEAGAGGVCDENIGASPQFADRSYWMARKRAYKALLDQLKNSVDAAPDRRYG